MNFMNEGEKMKIFFAIPYSQLCDEKYEVKKEYRDFLEKLTSKTKQMGCDYFLAHEREKWGKQYNSAEESTVIDFETIKKSDMLCVIPGVPNSGGVHVEMGWASANKVKMRIFLKENYTYSPMVTGIHELTDTKYYYYKEDFSEELLNMMIESIKEEMEK